MIDIPLFRRLEAIPAKLGAMSYVGYKVFDDPGLGVNLCYEQGDTKADIYLYNLGVSDIPDDVRSDLVMEFFEQSRGDIFSLVESGDYVDFETLVSEYVHIPNDSPDPTHLWASFCYRLPPSLRPVDETLYFSQLFMSPVSGYINKVRYTHSEEPSESNAEEMLCFLLEWGAAINAAAQGEA